MKRSLLTGILVLATGVSGLLAQKQGQQSKQGQPPAQQGQAEAQKPTGPAPKSQGEVQALQAVFQAQSTNNPDAVIKAADELLTKYADTDFKGTILVLEAHAYQQKGDRVKAQMYAEQAVAADPNNFQAKLALGEMIAQSTRENDLDREEKLTKAEKLLNEAISGVNSASKPNPQLTDDQWALGKKMVTAEAHSGLGMAQLARKKYDDAATQFKTAVSEDPQPAYQVRLASALQSAGKNDEAIATCDKLMAAPDVHPQIRQIAQAIRAQAIQSGGKATTPPPAAATPAAPATPATPAAPAEKKQ